MRRHASGMNNVLRRSSPCAIRAPATLRRGFDIRLRIGFCRGGWIRASGPVRGTPSTVKRSPAFSGGAGHVCRQKSVVVLSQQLAIPCRPPDKATFTLRYRAGSLFESAPQTQSSSESSFGGEVIRPQSTRPSAEGGQGLAPLAQLPELLRSGLPGRQAAQRASNFGGDRQEAFRSFVRQFHERDPPKLTTGDLLITKPYVSSPICERFSRFSGVLSIFEDSARLEKTAENT